MENLDQLDLAILRAVRDGGITQVTPFWQDSGHTEWLAENGYISEDGGGACLSQRGVDALASATDGRA